MPENITNSINELKKKVENELQVRRQNTEEATYSSTSYNNCGGTCFSTCFGLCSGTCTGCVGCDSTCTGTCDSTSISPLSESVEMIEDMVINRARAIASDIFTCKEMTHDPSSIINEPAVPVNDKLTSEMINNLQPPKITIMGVPIDDEPKKRFFKKLFKKNKY